MIPYLENKELFNKTAEIVFDTREDSEERECWHKNRTNSIGGSEIAKIAGLSKYGSALTVFNEKLGLSEKFKGNIHTKWGNRMEPIIKEFFMEDFKNSTGINIEVYDYPYMLTHKDFKFLSANLDGLAALDENFTFYENRDTGEIKYIPKGEIIGIEVKTASEFLNKMWQGDEIPDEYYCQVAHYMGITGLKHFLIIYLLGKEVKWKVVPRNDDDITALFDIGDKFWKEHIQTKIAPEPTGLEIETKDILYRQALDNDIEVSVKDNKLSRYKDIDERIKALEKDKEQLKQLIFLDMGDSKKGSDGNFKISRFEIKRDSLDTAMLKEKYPVTYQAVLKGQTEYVSTRITKCK